jgi:mycofactocin precursor
MSDRPGTSTVTHASPDVVAPGDATDGDDLADRHEPADDSLVLADLLIEDISIDGMCGVY